VRWQQALEEDVVVEAPAKRITPEFSLGGQALSGRTYVDELDI